MNATTLPCPTCSCTGTDTHEDRHTGTNMDTCRTCGWTGFIPARTGETAEASFRAARKKAGDQEEGLRGILHEEVRALVATARSLVAERDDRIAILEAELAAIRPAPTGSGEPDSRAGVERVRHLKRGTEYEVLFRGIKLQTALGMTEGETLVIYRGDDGRVWAREEAEFDDGRFAPTEGRAP